MNDITLKELNRRKKKYLLQYREALISEKILNDQIAELRSNYALPKSPNYDGMPHGFNSEHDLSDYAEKIDNLICLVQAQRDQAVDVCTDITRRIGSMSNETERDILRLRYLQGVRFTEIAELLHYTERHTLRLHGEALEHFPYECA